MTRRAAETPSPSTPRPKSKTGAPCYCNVRARFRNGDSYLIRRDRGGEEYRKSGEKARKMGLIPHGSFGLVAALWIALAFAQEPVPVPFEPSAAPAPAAAAAPAPTLPPVFQNSGKPIIVPVNCADEDFQWAGMVCSADDPCPIYLEITAVESVAGRIFAAGNIHSSSVTLYSELLLSDDNGQSWREAADRIRGAGFDRIQFADAENGWIGGQALFPFSRNPFLMVTTDGGKVWARQNAFAEERPGDLYDFLFTSKKDGRFVFDLGRGAGANRFELYESHDGGASWTIRGTYPRPPALRAAPAPSDWRTRVDAETQSFLIEKRDGARWVSVGAFAVRMGACPEK